MKLKEMVELIQQHHSHLGETEIIKLLNRAKDDFCERSEIVRATHTQATAANQRYYELDEGIIKILDVWLNDTKIPRLLEKPPIDDDTSETIS